MSYIYRVSRRTETERHGGVPEAAAPEVKVEPDPEVSYRDLQRQAKELDIPANQSRDELEAAIAEASE